MIITYDGCRYFIDKELSPETVVQLPNEEVIEVTKWWPTEPPTPMLWGQTEKTATVTAIPAGHSDVKAFTAPKNSADWMKLLKLQSPIVIYRSFELDDFMAHTHSALCQRIVSDVVRDADAWPMFVAEEYEIVGFERPTWLHIAADFRLRTSFNAASKRRNRRPRVR